MDDVISLDDLCPPEDGASVLDDGIQDVQTMFDEVDSYLKNRLQSRPTDQDEEDSSEESDDDYDYGDTLPGPEHSFADAQFQLSLQRAAQDLEELQCIAQQTTDALATAREPRAPNDASAVETTLPPNPSPLVSDDADEEVMDSATQEAALQELERLVSEAQAPVTIEGTAPEAASATQLRHAEADRMAAIRAKRAADNEQAHREEIARREAEVAAEAERAEAELTELVATMNREKEQVKEWQEQHRQEVQRVEQQVREQATAAQEVMSRRMEAIVEVDNECTVERERLAMQQEEERSLFIRTEEQNCRREMGEMGVEEAAGRKWHQQQARELEERSLMRWEDETAERTAAARRKVQQEMQAAAVRAAEAYEAEQRRSAAEAAAMEAMVAAAKLEADLSCDDVWGRYCSSLVDGEMQTAAAATKVDVQLREWSSLWRSHAQALASEHPAAAELAQVAAGWKPSDMAVLNLAHEQVSDVRELAKYSTVLAVKLPGNQIESLVGLEHCGALRELVLSENQLHAQPSVLEPLASLPLLQLDLDKNGLRQLQQLPPTLQMVKLAQNQLSDLGDSMTQCEWLTKIDLSRNEIGDVEQLQLPRSVTSLTLSGNRIRQLPSSAFSSIPMLSSLALDSNQIGELPSDLLQHPLLRHLWLNGNELSQLPSLGFAPMLHTLHLHDNNLTYVAPLHTCALLHTLDLSFNQLSSLPEALAAIAPCSRLVKLSLNDNPLSELPAYRTTMLTVSSSLQELDTEPVPHTELLTASDKRWRKEALLVAPLLLEWRVQPTKHLAVADRPAGLLSAMSRPALVLRSRVCRPKRGGSEAAVWGLVGSQAEQQQRHLAEWKHMHDESSQVACAAGVAHRMRASDARRKASRDSCEAMAAWSCGEVLGGFSANQEYAEKMQRRAHEHTEKQRRDKEAADQARLAASRQEEEDRRKVEEAEQKIREEQERKAREAAEAVARELEQKRVRKEAEVKAREEEQRRVREAAERKALEEEVKRLRQAEILRLQQEEERKLEQERRIQQQARQQAAERSAAMAIQKLVRGSIVRSRLQRAKQRAAFVDDDEFDYAAVDEDFLPDISGLELGLDELLGGMQLQRPAGASVAHMIGSAAVRPSSRGGRSPVPRVVIDASLSQSGGLFSAMGASPRSSSIRGAPLSSLTVLPNDVMAAWEPTRIPSPGVEPDALIDTGELTELPADENLDTYRSDVSDAQSCASSQTSSSRVASRLRDAVQDNPWGLKDPTVQKTFEARRKKMARMQRDSQKKKTAHDPAKRMERFRQTAARNGSESHRSNRDDDDNMSVVSFGTVESEVPSSFQSAAPNRKLMRSQGERGHSSASLRSQIERGCHSSSSDGSTRRGRAVATQHVVLSNNFLS